MTGLVMGIPTAWHLVAFDTPPSPAPGPTDVLRPGLTEWDVSPGLIGFLAMFVVVVASVAVWFSMNGKLRRIQHDEKRMAEAAGTEADASSASAATLDAPDTAHDDAVAPNDAAAPDVTPGPARTVDSPETVG